MLKKIFFAIVLVLAVFAVYVAMQPADFRVERSTAVNATPSVVFNQVNDFHNWEAWSPWAKRDPNSKATFEGAAAGQGAVFKWSGNDEVGEGQMTIVESKPNESIRLKLDFVKPFESTADTLFTFKPQGEGTVVTWAMTGKNNFIARAMCMFMDMDKMVGGDFEKGLASMKSIAEAKK